ncbi:MAG: hypothetical protein U0X91_00090 [Spirosomataceae bacterium]
MLLLNWIDFDTRPLLWWLFGYLFLGVFSSWLILRNRPVSDLLFIGVLFLISGLMRLPVLFHNLPLNPDESQMLAQGLTLTFDPLLYRSVDPTTSGPINNYVLAFFHGIGFKLDFRLAHVLSWLITLSAVTFLYKALKQLVSDYIAQLAVIPTLAFFTFAQNANYLHYYSEGMAILFLSFNVYLLARWTRRREFSALALMAFGISTGLVVLCKIQALPLSFVFGVWALFLLYSLQKQKAVLYGCIVAGSVLAVWGGWLWYMQANDVLNDFFFYYITANAQLKMHFSDSTVRPFFYLLVRFPLIIFKRAFGLEYWFFPFVLLTGVFLLNILKKEALLKTIKLNHYFWLMLAGYFLMVVAVIIRTGSFYPHHFLYFILPGCLFLGLYLNQLKPIWRWVILSTQLIFVAVCIKRLATGYYLNLYTTEVSDRQELSPVGKAILKYGKPGEFLVVWGWSCEYYVETQMPQGVNENHSVRSAMKHPLQAAYYQRYMRDIQRTRPKVFVDAMTPKTLWMNDPKLYGHQNYPELARFIAENYTFKEEIKGVKIYARK